MLQLYLKYVQTWGTSQTRETHQSSEWTQAIMKRLEGEWKFAKRIAISVLSGESCAAKCFW
jgi:hypothetical protein